MAPTDDTLNALRNLNDLDLGALVHRVGEGTSLTQAHVDSLRASPIDVEEQAYDWPAASTMTEGCKGLAALGAMARVALPKDPNVSAAIAGGRAAQDALCRVANVCGTGSGTWAEIATKAIDEITRLRGLLDSRNFADAAALVKPLRTFVGAEAVTAEQVIASTIAELREARANGASADRVLDRVRTALGWDTGKGPLSEFAAEVRKHADATMNLIEGRITTSALVDLQMSSDPSDPITIAKALLRQAAAEVDPGHRLALIVEARQWATLAGV